MHLHRMMPWGGIASQENGPRPKTILLSVFLESSWISSRTSQEIVYWSQTGCSQQILHSMQGWHGRSQVDWIVWLVHFLRSLMWGRGWSQSEASKKMALALKPCHSVSFCAFLIAPTSVGLLQESSKKDCSGPRLATASRFLHVA